MNEALIWGELTPLLELKEDRESAERLRRILEKARSCSSNEGTKGT